METAFNLEKQLQVFQAFLQKSNEKYQIFQPAPDVLKISRKSLAQKKVPTLGLMALVHGNEILGLPIINQVLEKILNNQIEAEGDIIFALGNVAAAFQNTRYNEQDLNRCFGLQSHESLEAKRAHELEKIMLKDCDYLLDLHQTTEATRSAFFIFPYSSKDSLHFLRKINKGIPVILQKTNISEMEGLTSDEYFCAQGKIGMTLELGQMGHSSEYFELGLQVCLNAIQQMSLLQPSNTSIAKLPFPLFQLSDKLHITDENTELKQGWQNFQKVQIGEVVGEVKTASGKTELVSPSTGFMIFPKYKGMKKVGHELFHICTEISAENLDS